MVVVTQNGSLPVNSCLSGIKSQSVRFSVYFSASQDMIGEMPGFAIL